MSIFYRKKLPHLQPPQGTFFITYRLHGSIPMAKIRQFKIMPSRSVFKKSKDLRNAWYFRCSDNYLDSNPNGPYWLAKKEIAEIVFQSLLFNHGRQYDLHAFCIMSNHVHVLLTAKKGAPELYRMMQAHKSFTAVMANRILGRSGKFWELESYDHLVRNNKSFQRILWYILNNPVKAGLVKHWRDWPNSWVAPEFMD
jgi:putative transposase